jgi:hypothetical protein
LSLSFTKAEDGLVHRIEADLCSNTLVTSIRMTTGINIDGTDYAGTTGHASILIGRIDTSLQHQWVLSSGASTGWNICPSIHTNDKGQIAVAGSLGYGNLTIGGLTGGTGSTASPFVFTIDDTHLPESLSLSNNSINEDAAVGSTIGNLSSSDNCDDDLNFSYSLVAGTGDTHNASFQIAGDELQTLLALDYETLPVMSVRIKVTDQGGLTREGVFAINVNDVVEGPASVGELTSNQVTLFPNPFQDLLHISAPSDTQIVIYNAQGAVVFKGKSNVVNTADWSTGMYVIETISNHQTTTRSKLIKAF